MPVAPGMVAPLDGTPDDQGVSGTPEGGKKNKSGGPRRKVGRWSEEETNTLILLTNQACQLLLPAAVPQPALSFSVMLIHMMLIHPNAPGLRRSGTSCGCTA